MKYVNKRSVLSTFAVISVAIFATIALHIMQVNNSVRRDLTAIRQQEALLHLPPPKSSVETTQGCTWAERRNWDTEGCYIGVSNVYDERGPKRAAEQTITAHLLAAGWQKRNSTIVWDSPAAHIFGNDGSFVKTTPGGRFCAGFTYRYFSNDIANGHRSLGFYLLGPLDKGCSRW